MLCGHEWFRSLEVARAVGDGPGNLLGVLPLVDPPGAMQSTTLRQARWVFSDQDGDSECNFAIAKETAKYGGWSTTIFSIGSSLAMSQRKRQRRPAKSNRASDGLSPKFPLNTSSILSMCCKNTVTFVGMEPVMVLMTPLPLKNRGLAAFACFRMQTERAGQPQTLMLC